MSLLTSIREHFSHDEDSDVQEFVTLQLYHKDNVL